MATYIQGTTATLLAQWFEYPGGPAVDVSAQTITIIKVSDASIVLGPTGVGIVHLATGLYSFSWPIPPAQDPGDYVVVWNATDAALEPVQTSELIGVQNISSSSSGDPCDVWDLDVSCCQEFWDTLSADEQTRALKMASYYLWANTGRRYNNCPVTVRPCGNDCNDDGIGGWYWSGGMFVPYVVDGVWRNCWCSCAGSSCCACRPSCQVYLPGPVREIVSVVVDGVVVDPATYRVDDGRWLVRTGAGNCWPQCQDFNVSSGAGTMFVTYGRGEAPPTALLSAGGGLACEYAKMCRGEECRLAPAFVTSISRQGVEFTMANPVELLQLGITGIWELDQLIAADNPFRLTHRLRLLTPDEPGPRVTTWP